MAEVTDKRISNFAVWLGSWCVNFISATRIKYPDKGNLGRKKVISVYNSRLQSVIVGNQVRKFKCQSQCIAVQSREKYRRAWWSACWLATVLHLISSLCSSGSQAKGRCHPQWNGPSYVSYINEDSPSTYMHTCQPNINNPSLPKWY